MYRILLTAFIIAFGITEENLCARLLLLPSDTLPVAVHVIHTGNPVGAPDNPSDSLINAMIGQMNDAFNLNGPNYGGANLEITFQLAIRSPECTSTTGINRIDGTNIPKYSNGGITLDTTFYNDSAFDRDVKALSRWPNTDYINIWIVNTIDANPFFPGGYAFFPEYNSAVSDGIVLRASAVNGTNKTIVHELGHYLFLYHTFGYAWENCMPETNCTQDGDLICDTENCNYQTNCDVETNPCTGVAWIIVDAEHQYTLLNNYMGYTDCQWMFTEGQKTRMQYALNTFRSGLLSSHAFDSDFPSGTMPACIPVAEHGLSPYYGIERVEIGSINVYSNTSEADGTFYIDRMCNQSIEVTAGDTIPIRITTSYLNRAQVKVYIDYDNDGSFIQSGESILAADGWIIEDTIVIPLTQIELCTPLRLRIVVDHPAAPPPTACMLTGTEMEGVGQIEDYALIIKPRHVESQGSGDWTNPAIWSGNSVPSALDFVQIKAGNTINITPAMGVLACADMHFEQGAQLQMNGVLHVAGGCD